MGVCVRAYLYLPYGEHMEGQSLPLFILLRNTTDTLTHWLRDTKATGSWELW